MDGNDAKASASRRVRIRVHRRPRKWARRGARALAFAALLCALTDAAHPRSLRALASRAAEKSGAIELRHAACTTRPRAWRVRSLQLALVEETELCWTPSEHIVLLRVPPARAALIPASWASLQWHAVQGNATLRSQGRFAPATAVASDAVVVEYASGCMPAVIMQRALLEAFVAGSPVPALRAPFDIVMHLLRYAQAVIAPRAKGAVQDVHNVSVGAMLGLVSKSAALEVTRGSRRAAEACGRIAARVTSAVDAPLACVRRFAVQVRDRRSAVGTGSAARTESVSSTSRETLVSMLR